MAFEIRNRIKALVLVLLFSIVLPILPYSSYDFPSQYSEKVDTNERLTGFEGQPFNEIEDLEKFFEGNSSSHLPLAGILLSEYSHPRSIIFSHSIPNYLSQPPPFLS
jgi:hypothetical protein